MAVVPVVATAIAICLLLVAPKAQARAGSVLMKTVVCAIYETMRSLI